MARFSAAVLELIWITALHFVNAYRAQPFTIRIGSTGFFGTVEVFVRDRKSVV